MKRDNHKLKADQTLFAWWFILSSDTDMEGWVVMVRVYQVQVYQV